MDHEVFKQAHAVHVVRLDRQGDATVPPDVSQLLLLKQVGGDYLILIETDPDATDLCRPVAVQCDQVCDASRLDDAADYFGYQDDFILSLPADRADLSHERALQHERREAFFVVPGGLRCG
jgi:hypothetical protein